MFKFIIILSTSFLLSGCVFSAANIPEAKDKTWVADQGALSPRPEILRSEDSNNVPPATGQLNLAAALDWALSHNPKTEQSYLRARQAAASKGIAWSKFYPEISAQYPIRHERSENAGFPVIIERTVSEPSVNVTMTLLDFGTRGGDLDEARARVEAASLLHNRTIQEVIFGVTQRYFLLNAAIAAEAADKQSVADALAHERVVERSVAVGLKPRVELLQAVAQRRSAELGFEESKAAIEEARAAFALELGSQISGELGIAPVAVTLQRSKDSRSVSEWIQEALQVRPDLRAAYAEASAAAGKLRSASSRAWPELVASARWSEGNPHGSNSKEENYTYGIGVQIPIFSGFANSYAVKRATAARDEAIAVAVMSEQQVAAQVWQSFFAVQSAEHRLEAALALREASEEAYRVLEKSYETGSQALVDVLSAQADLAKARKAVVSAEAQYAIALAALALASGETNREEGGL